MPRPIPTDDTTRIAIAGAPFDTLFPAQFSGREAIGAVTELNLRATGATPAIALSGLTGQHATLSLKWSDSPRLIDAVCTRAGGTDRDRQSRRAHGVTPLRPESTCSVAAVMRLIL